MIEHEHCFPIDSVTYYLERSEEAPAFKSVILRYLWTNYSICLSLGLPNLIREEFEKFSDLEHKSGIADKIFNSTKIEQALSFSPLSAFIALLAAYENFICGSLKTAIQFKTEKPGKGSDFEVVFASVFGQESLQHCWINDLTQTFLKMGEALVNSDGVVSENLAYMLRGTEMVQNGRLDIERLNNDHLLTVLFDGSSFLVDYISKNYEQITSDLYLKPLTST